MHILIYVFQVFDQTLIIQSIKVLLYDLGWIGESYSLNIYVDGLILAILVLFEYVISPLLIQLCYFAWLIVVPFTKSYRNDIKFFGYHFANFSHIGVFFEQSDCVFGIFHCA